jgi:hypothetical protein
MSGQEHEVVGKDPKLALPLPTRVRPPAEGTPQSALVSAKRRFGLPPLTVHPMVPASRRLLPEPLDHLPPVLGLRPLPALPAGVQGDHGGPHPEVLPGVPVVRLGIERGVGQDAIPGHGQGRLGEDPGELGGIVGRAGGGGRPGEEVAPGVTRDGQLGPQPGRVLPAGSLEEIPGRMPAFQAGAIDRGGRLRADQAAVGCGRSGPEEEDDDLPFFSSRAAA